MGKRATGIEPVTGAWKAQMLPLHHARWQAHLESNQEHNLRRIGLYPFNYEPIWVILPHPMGSCQPMEHKFGFLLQVLDIQKCSTPKRLLLSLNVVVIVV